ncbi:MAG: helix-turn-helix domain-containing protein [Planctomycetota bacterium]|jgi:excisionase family DNA binding protein
MTRGNRTRPLKDKELFSTGDAATICQVSQQTIIRWVDQGRLEGFRIPGSRTRRIPREALLRFLREHHMPLRGLEAELCRVLVIDADRGTARRIEQALRGDEHYDIRAATTAFDAGFLLAREQPNLVLVSVEQADIDARAVCETVRDAAELRGARLIATTSTATSTPEHLLHLIDDVIDVTMEPEVLRRRLVTRPVQLNATRRTSQSQARAPGRNDPSMTSWNAPIDRLGRRNSSGWIS